MKKKILIPVILAVVLLAFVLFLPIPKSSYDDGGTKEYVALTYKIVDWNKIINADEVYDKTCVYFGDDRNKSLDELWVNEVTKLDEAGTSFKATVLQMNPTSVLVQPLQGEQELNSSDQISFVITDLPDIMASVGDVVEVTYIGGIMESYPAQINAVNWSISNDLRQYEYTEQWLDKSTSTKYDNNIFDHVTITKIYSNCFFATSVIPMPYQIKFNGKLSDDWCVGDQITCTYDNTYYDTENHRVEVDMLTISASDWTPDPNVCYKPVIYLYPETETEAFVTLSLNGKLTCTYPEYNDGWEVKAFPDGTLADENGQIYNYLYWEGETDIQYDLSKGFCVKGEDTALFLENALEKLGLTRKEANEFIVYWLPLMQNNPYNIISFQTDCYTKAATLNIDPAPDTLIRVFMSWHSADKCVDIPAQNLTAPERTGFTVVEWGGTEIIK